MQAKFVPRPNFLFLKDDSDNGTIRWEIGKLL